MDNQQPIVFFDGVCNFCNYWVMFAIRRDKQKRLKFSPLQGETATTLLARYQVTPSRLSSVILLEKDSVWTQSSAALRICKYLDGGWKIFYGLIIIPKFIRDFLYNIIALNRYRWFGKRDECKIPEPGISERFLP